MEIVRESLELFSDNVDVLLNHNEIISFCRDHSNKENFITRVYALIVLYWCVDIDDKLSKYIDNVDEETDIKYKLTYLECLYNLKDIFEEVIKNMVCYNKTGDVSCSIELYRDFKNYIYDIKCPDMDELGRCSLYDE